MVVRVPTATPAPGRRRLIIIVVAVVAALLVAFTALSGFFVDVLWFREVRLSDVFWTVLRTRVFLGLAFVLTFLFIRFSVRMIRAEVSSSPSQSLIHSAYGDSRPCSIIASCSWAIRPRENPMW